MKNIIQFHKKAQQEDLDSKIKLRIELEEKNIFQDEEKRRLRVKGRNKKLIVLGVILFLYFLLSILLPRAFTINQMSLAYYLKILIENLQDFGTWVSGGYATGVGFSVCRYVMIALVGAALATCGAVYQGSFKNAMASPTTLGVQSGGMLAGTLFILFGISDASLTQNIAASELKTLTDAMSIFELYAQQLVILAGCFFGVVLIVGIARIAGRGKISSVVLILAGTVFSSLISSGASLVQYYLMLQNASDTKVEMLRVMMMGSFDNTFTLTTLLLAGIPILICIGVILCLRAKLNILVFGEDEARAMGLKVERFRNTLIAVCTLLTAVCISFCGQVAFVGLMVPHLARLLVGPDFRVLVPASTLLGAIFMLLVYNIGVWFGYASNISLVTSAVGGVMFLVFMLKYRRKRNADWA